MISGANFVTWATVGVLVVSILAAAWALLMIFAAGMKTVPAFTSQEAFSAALPSLVLLPGSVGLSILSVRWTAGKVPIALAIVSAVINLACVLIAAITYGVALGRFLMELNWKPRAAQPPRYGSADFDCEVQSKSLYVSPCQPDAKKP